MQPLPVSGGYQEAYTSLQKSQNNTSEEGQGNCKRKCLRFLGALSRCLKSDSIGRGNVWPRSQMSSSFDIFSFWFAGAIEIRSFIIPGKASVTF